MNTLIFLTLCLPSAGFSALQWLTRYTFHRATMNEQDRGRVDYGFGINSPALAQAWTDLRHGRPGDKPWSYELRKNQMAEWGKLDAHRAVFFMALVAVFWFAVAVGAAVVALVVV